MARARIIALMLSDADDACAHLATLLAEATAQPNSKLQSSGSARVLKAPSTFNSQPPKLCSPPISLSMGTTSVKTVVHNNPVDPVPSSLTTSVANEAVPLTLSMKAQAHAGSEEGTFCVCGRLDDDPDETFVACAVGTGGCHGWVHLSCMELSECEKDEIIISKKFPKYVCRLCRDSCQTRGEKATSKSFTDGLEPRRKRPSSVGVQPSREALLKKMKSLR